MLYYMEIREGSTASLKFQVLSGGLPINLAGMTEIKLELKDNTGVITTYSTQDTAPKLKIDSAADGTLKFYPADGTFVESKGPYRAVLIINDGLQKFSYPASEAMLIHVAPKYA